MRIVLMLLLVSGAPLFAQNGDRKGEVQVPPMKESEIPRAPILPPQDSLKTFKLQPGFRIELVAAEPLIQAPVAMAFHPNGSLYVLEMRGFMPNVDGKGEDEKVGRVSVLQDTDGDGRMDKSTVFHDELVMPRAIALAYDGVLIAEPPNLWFCKDTNGDLVADEKQLVASNYGSQGNPEHNANGLLWAMDNWIYSAKHTNRLRRLKGEWMQEPNAVLSGRGQWGISHDDFGRLVFNSNSDYLRADFLPTALLHRNKNLASPFGANVQLDKNQAVFPIRPNPGVNRGYQKGQLREDFTLATFTAACGPVIYRGDQFEESFYGAAFVCEPSANLVRGSKIIEENGVLRATNAFPNAEFLASTDERFRPVNLYNGPDGALYVVDMHRGVLQHRIFLTTYLRNQSLSRGLEQPQNHGRIYRVVQDARPRRKIEALPKETASLVAGLNHSNGWTRDTSQRLLVERADASAVEPLMALARGNRNDASAAHALWTLHGLEKLDAQTVNAALSSKNPRTRATAAMLAAPGEALFKAAIDSDPFVRLHAALSLTNKESFAALAQIVETHANEPLFRDAALSGLGGQEIAFTEFMLARPAWKESKPGFDKFLISLARAATEGDSNMVSRVLELAAAEKNWRRTALIDGILAVTPVSRGRAPVKPKPIKLAAEPVALATLKKEKDLAERVSKLEALLLWPGKEGAAEVAVKPLSPEETELFDLGKSTYTLTCAACHQPNGLGQDGLAPPLVDAEWVTGSPKRLARIVLHGMRGPLTVKGKEYSLEMPPLGILEDKQIAGILTYIRREWNHTASPVTTEFITKLREADGAREEPWTEAELLKE